MKSFKDLSLVILGTLLWLFILIPLIIIPVALPLTIYKLIVTLIAKAFRPDLVPVNKTDALFTGYPTDSKPVASPTQVWKLKGVLNLQKFQAHFQQTFLSSEGDRRRYQNLYCDFQEFMLHVFKRKVKLDLERHIYEIRVEDLAKRANFDSASRHKIVHGPRGDSDGFEASSERVVDQFIGHWMAQHTFPQGGPSWEIVIIQPKKGDLKGGSVLCFKIHHGLCDGYSFIHMIEKLTGNKSPYRFEEAKLDFKTKVRRVLQAPTTLLWLWAQVSLNNDLLFPPKTKTPSWYISFTTLDLNLVKNIRRQTKTHFVNILMSIQTGALRKFFLKSGTASSQLDLPANMGIGHSLGWPNHPAMNGRGLTNHLILCFCELDSCLSGYQIPLRDPDPLNRLEVAEAKFLEFEDRGGCELMRWVLFLGTWVNPSFGMRLYIKMNLGLLRYTHYFSSLMCSSQDYSLLGLPVKNLYLPLVVESFLPSTAMFAVTTTHSGQLDLSINGSSELFKSQEELDVFTQVYFQEELKSLASACGISAPENLN